MEMAFSSRALFLYTSVFNLACIAFSLNSADEFSDVQCLKSIKDSLEDPFNYLTWSFDDLQVESFCHFVGVQCWNDQEFRILNITLRDKGLRGQFPLGIENCKSLAVLDLSGNDLFGPIPLDLCQKLPNLVVLNLSNNKFSGEIPSTLADCKYLNVLILSDNHLTGQIPEQLGQLERLKTFRFTNNQLSGPVPNFVKFVNVSTDIYANNNGLCGGPLKPCEGKGSGLEFDFSFGSGFVVGYVFFSVLVSSSVVYYVSYEKYFEWKTKGENPRSRIQKEKEERRFESVL